MKNHKIWFYTIEFLKTYSTLYYNRIPIIIPLLRNFQNFLKNKPLKEAKDKTFNLDTIQSKCNPFLINNNGKPKSGDYILVRAELYTIGLKIFPNCIFLAHSKKEYLTMKKHRKCRPLYYLHDLPEKDVIPEEETKVFSELEKIFNDSQTPELFKNKQLYIWMRKQVKKLLVLIRKVSTLFEKYSFFTTLYGSTINNHGALVTTFAQTRNIKTINYQHGILGELGHLPINADINILWGNSHLEYLKRFGVPLNKMKILMPIFPKSIQSKLQINERKLQTSKLESIGKHTFVNGKFHVLVALQPLSHDFNKKMIRDIELAANDHYFQSKLHIHYKLHPDHESSEFKKLIINGNSQLYSHGVISTQELLSKTNLVITQSSTIAYEAFISNKPVVFYSKPTDIYYLEGNPYFIDSKAKVERLFYKMTQNEKHLPLILSRTNLKDKFEGDKLNNFKELRDLIRNC
ncbi:hypothetical protein [Metabacillus halosaccharovorans]|uniref:hypothetical protein n=1 Tax=Metabacillus halosaccharovorans TaxID=930124 RepID=UPI001C1FEFF2|nr:hypothetical protein [Metabacillus halosaccharovorans]MBU7592273.1 hypothetical protein [Metabacillus halosaccharovorans]